MARSRGKRKKKKRKRKRKRKSKRNGGWRPREKEEGIPSIQHTDDSRDYDPRGIEGEISQNILYVLLREAQLLRAVGGFGVFGVFGG
jgi:hypothetical protein